MRVVIVDDEPIARRRLGRMLDKHADVEIVGEASDGDEALEVIAATSPDAVLLDIHMPGRDGLAVARSLAEPRPHVVFVTAYDQHAIDAFDAAAIDYLLKPVEAARLDAALERLRRASDTLPPALGKLIDALTGGSIPRVFARQGDRVYPVDARQVSRFWAADKYTAFVFEGDTLYLEDSLNDLEARLDDHGFVRVHRAELVNIAEIRSIATVDDKLVVELRDGQTAPVSRRMAKELKAKLGLS